MKEGIYLIYYYDVVVRCVCGEIFIIGLIKKEIYVEICLKCYLFFIGK